MDWLEKEPRLDEVLSDPIVEAVMARDGIEPESLRSFLTDVGNALYQNPSKASTSPWLRYSRGG